MLTGKIARILRRRRVRVGLAALAGLAVLAFLVGWSPLAAFAARLTISRDALIAEQQPDPVYEQVVARYAEICATSQWRKQVGGRGNPFGHAVIYLKGAMKDADAPFPQLRRSAHVATSVDDPEHGVGVSVGRFFRNVNWIAVPGHRLTFEGLTDDGRVTQAALAQTVRRAIDMGVFDGVALHAPWSAEDDASLEAFVTASSVGTDFALRFARNVFCARIPVTQAQMDEIIAFLNDKNAEYATGEADYDWNLFNHNCVHTVRNALAAASVWSPLSVGDVKLRALLNLAVPANEFVNLAVRGADGPLDDVGAIMADPTARDALQDFGWLPRRHGALVKFLPAIQDNEVFDPEFRLWAVQSLLRMGMTADAARLMGDPVHTDIEANLAHFVRLYDDLAQAAPPSLASVHGDPARRIGRVHAAYVAEQTAEAAAMLDAVRALKAARADAAGASASGG